MTVLWDDDAERDDAEDASPVHYTWVNGSAFDEDDVPRDPS